MPLRDIIENNVISCSKDTSISDIADLMKTNDVGAVLVVENEKPVGIVTDRDIVLRCIAENVKISEPVATIMTKSVDTVSWNAGLQDAIAQMRDKKVRRIPVVDDQGKAVGLISFGDVFGLIAKEMSELSHNTPVKAA